MIWITTPDNPPTVTLRGAPTEPTTYAKDRLSAYLRRVLNVPTDGQQSDTAIVLQVDVHAGLSDEGYAWRIVGKELQLIGGGELGLVFAVFAFLREICGCSFAGLGPDSEHVPQLDRITVEQDSGPREPLLWYRGIQISYLEKPELIHQHLDWMVKNGLNYVMHLIGPDETLTGQQQPVDPHTGEPLIEFGERSPRIQQGWFEKHVTPEIRKRGLKRDMNHHNLGFWLPSGRYFKDHPEWFSLIDGERGNHFNQMCICTSNEQAVETLIQNILVYLRDHPDVPIVGVIPEDGNGMCQCDACVAGDPNPEDAFKDWGVTDSRKPEGINHSLAARYARLVNRVARAVRDEFPDVLVGSAAYVDLAWPPQDIALEDNVVTWVAIYWRDAAQPLSPSPTTSHNNFYFGTLRQWRAYHPGRLTLYEYYMGMNAQCSLPYPMSEVICEDWPHLRKLGIDGATIQCTTTVHQSYALNMLAFARCGWQAKVNHAALLDEFLSGMFGAPGKAIRTIYAGLLNAIRRLADDGVVLQPRGDNIAYFIEQVGRKEIERALTEATQLATTDRERRQVERFTTYMHYCLLAATASQTRLDIESGQPDTNVLRQRAIEDEIPAVLAFIEQHPLPGWTSPAHGARWQSHLNSLVVSTQGITS